jgi:16S rRNA (guanine527-N7)-methyltransferase
VSGTEARLRAFAALVAAWTPRINLVGAADLPALWERHIEDCLQLVPLLPAGLDRAIDLGSGAGFPGLVLAIATDLPFDLIEADRRKATFLAEAAHRLGAPARVHACRIEAATVAPARLVTARALAPLQRLLPLAAPLLAPGGICLFPKGHTAAEELTDARRQWHMDVDSLPNRVHPGGVIYRIGALRRAI